MPRTAISPTTRVTDVISKFASVSLLATAIGVALATAPAQAASLGFTIDETRGAASTDTDVILTDIDGGVEFSFAVNDQTNTSDLVAVYFNVAETIPNDFSIVGGDVTKFEFDTRNVVAGNIGEIFDVGVQIGNTGSSGEFFDSFTFNVYGTDLDVTDFYEQTFAVRGQSVGPIANGGGNQSSKEFGIASPQSNSLVTQEGAAVPEPATILGLALGGSALMAAKKKLG